MVDLQSFSEDLIALINTLESVEVRGTKNMSMLMGCIQKLQAMLTLSQEAKKQQ